jgi:FKBP-type peptidyl-prolyl cis-trans isomerase 2
MSTAQIGSRVAVQYVGTLDNGRIFHSTEEGEPLEFTVGAGEVFTALEAGVIGMATGEVRNIFVPAAAAYGPRREENVLCLARSAFPADKEIIVGQKLGIDFKGGRSLVMLVLEVGETTVTLDGNHPLAGLDLTFALRLDRIDD